MAAWIGPAIVAAIISGLISLIVVQLNFRQEWKAEQRRRAEKIRDYQIALRAEIRSEIHALEADDPEKNLADIRARYDMSPTYSVTVPFPVHHVVFEVVSREIQILPAGVIDPLILYTRQRYTIDRFVEDLRSDAFRAKDRTLQLQMYSDYLALRSNLLVLARDAVSALETSLNEQTINSLASARSVR